MRRCPRNRLAVARSLRHRREIRRAWLALIAESPFERVTVKAISRRLPFKLAPSTTAWHMSAIRTAALIESLESAADRLETFR